MTLQQTQTPRKAQQLKPRRLPIGAEVTSDGAISFRVWAPSRQKVEVVFEDALIPPLPLIREEGGYFSGVSTQAHVGALYRFGLDDSGPFPDPASRFQPQGPNGPSEIIDHTKFNWTDTPWRGIENQGQILYELHIGTFTPEGTWDAAARQLPALADLGITCLEVMPVAEFAGKFGWGYDGVDLFSPTHLYGNPDAFRRFVDQAHAAGMGVILDVVYNHFGPDGNYLKEFAREYFTSRHTDWGEAINFDAAGSTSVREFFLANAQYWIEEFHLDGFRFDAVHAIADESKEHIMAAIGKAARAAAGDRKVLLVAENEPQQTRFVRPLSQGGCELSALWNDDFHHSAMVVLSGRNEAYYQDHLGNPQEFISAAKWNFLFQGQRHSWQKKRRGTPALDLPPAAFINFLENHDQIANSGRSLRSHQLASPASYRAMTALFLLLPQTPMLFQGQEWAASSKFHYFADHNEELSKLIRIGRAKKSRSFPASPPSLCRPIFPSPMIPRPSKNQSSIGPNKINPNMPAPFGCTKTFFASAAKNTYFTGCISAATSTAQSSALMPSYSATSTPPVIVYCW